MKGFKAALLLGGSALIAGGVHAQAVTPVALSDSDTEASEIVVTAQNRVQNAQDVPIVMNVVSAEQLANAGFRDTNDLSKIAPIAQVTQDQGTVRITIRGIGISGGPDTSVVTNIDGEYINQPAALGTALFDIERVEVLRGPQGVNYGRNSTAGNVNYILRKPGDTFAGNASVSYGNYNSVRADAGVTIPIASGIGVRLAGFYEDRDGYVKHPALAAGSSSGFAFPSKPAGRSDDNHAYGGRVSIQGKEIGGSGLSVYLAGEYSERRFSPQLTPFVDNHQPQYFPGSRCQNPGWISFAPLITDQTLCIPQSTQFLDTFNRKEYEQPRNGIGTQYWNTTAVRGRIDYKLSSAATISYIGGYRYFEIDPRSNTSLPRVYVNLVDHNKFKTQSHELRVAGEVGPGILYQIGGFYFKETNDTLNGFYLGDKTGQNFGFFINTFKRDSKSDSKSIFGQVEVPLLDTLTAVAGARYTDTKRHSLNRDKSAAAFLSGPTVRNLDSTNSDFRDLRSQDDKITWLAGLNYKPDARTLIYGKISTGFKGGGFDNVGTFGPETNTAYEAGIKKNFGDRGQHHFNLSAFRYDYKGLQVNVLLNSAEGGRTFNAGAVKIQGIEAEAQFELDRRTHFNATVNYLDSKYTEFRTIFNVYCVANGSPAAQAAREANEGGVGSCVSNGQNLTGIGDLDPNTPGAQQPNLAGNPTPFSPQFVITAGIDHRFDLGGVGSLTARLDTTFKTRYYTGTYKQSDSAQKPFTQTDFSLEYRSRNGISVTGFVRNIENVRPLSFGAFIAAATDDQYYWQWGTPRTYGVRVGYEF